MTSRRAENLDISKLIMELESLSSANGNTSIDFKSWPLDLLADNIEKTYHRYIEEKTPIINEYLTKICNVHGQRHPELHIIHEIFVASTTDLYSHMRKEESILLVLIRFDYKQSAIYHTFTFDVLDSIINILKKNKVVTISIDGYAYKDEGSDTICYYLSLNRALFIQNYIMGR